MSKLPKIRVSGESVYISPRFLRAVEDTAMVMISEGANPRLIERYILDSAICEIESQNANDVVLAVPIIRHHVRTIVRNVKAKLPGIEVHEGRYYVPSKFWRTIEEFAVHMISAGADPALVENYLEVSALQKIGEAVEFSTIFAIDVDSGESLTVRNRVRAIVRDVHYALNKWGVPVHEYVFRFR